MPARYPVDLQVHTGFSDGTESPDQLVQRAARMGIQVLAVTDHDTVAGLKEALAAGDRYGVTVVPALEFSTTSEPDRDYLEINILAYGIRPDDADLQRVLLAVMDSRVEQKIRQIEVLQSYGVDVPIDEVLRMVDGVPGRVHIARVALEHNPSRFVSIQDVFDQFLATDAPNSTFVPRSFSLRAEETIELAHAAGGVAVLAHPGSYTRVGDVDDVVRRLANAGLDGVEVRYPYAQNRGHYGASGETVQGIIAHFDGLADDLNLLKTGGSDYHGATKPGIQAGDAGLTWAEWDLLRPLLNC